MTDRALQWQELSTPGYEIAAAAYSHGDVLKIFSSPDQSATGIFLGDTTGHDAHDGRRMSQFLDRCISRGWGLQGSVEDILQLSRKAKQENAPICTFTYAVLKQDKLLLSNFGNPFPIHYADSISDLFLAGPYLDLIEELHEEIGATTPENNGAYIAPQQFLLQSRESIILYTDGITEAYVKKHFALPANVLPISKEVHMQQHGDKALQAWSRARQITHRFFRQPLEQTAKESAAATLRAIIEQRGDYFIPTTAQDDDASLIVIKRT